MFGAPRRGGATPRVETVRITAPDLARRAAMEKTRGRLVVTAGAFALLFLAVVAKLADATDPPAGRAAAAQTDRVARSPTSRQQRHACRVRQHTQRDDHRPQRRDPRRLAAGRGPLCQPEGDDGHRDAAASAEGLPCRASTKTEDAQAARLGAKQFVYLRAACHSARRSSRSTTLGIPGVFFQAGGARQKSARPRRGPGAGRRRCRRARRRRRRDARSRSGCATDPTPLRLSLDVRVQAAVRDELSKAMTEFTGHRRLRHRHGCPHRRSHRHGQPARLRRQRVRQDRARRPLQPRRHRHVRARQHLQAADRRHGAGQRRRPHLESSTTPSTTSRSAASPSPISRASTAGSTCRRCWPTRPISAPPISQRASAPRASGRGSRTWA